MKYDIIPGVTYIGLIDKDLDLFEGQYPVPDGITYNSYIIADEKTAILNTADARVSGEWMDDVTATLGERIPDYLIIQHMEPDHAANISALLRKYPDITLVATAPALKMIPLYNEEIGDNVNTITVKDGDTLSLGSRSLKFITAPMVHWPEVVTVLDENDGIYFSADAFGTFGTAMSTDNWDNEARRYYYNICGKYGQQVQALLKKVAGLEINVICPLHGPVLKDNLAHYIKLYDRWSRHESDEQGVLIAYASIYGHTAAAAREIARRLNEAGCTVETVDLNRHDHSDALGKAFRYSTMILAAPTYDAGLFPPMDSFLRRLAAKGYHGRHVAVIENGSWAPAAARKMKELLGEMKDITIIEPSVSLNGAHRHINEEAISTLTDAVVKATLKD